jgi:hypothetical protein
MNVDLFHGPILPWSRKRNDPGRCSNTRQGLTTTPRRQVIADRSVPRDDRDDKPRWIVEHKLLRRWRRIKDVWRTFVFLARGGKFKVVLDFSRIDPRILEEHDHLYQP